MPVLNINKFEGMSTQIAEEKHPAVLFKRIINGELVRTEGWIRKRRGYSNVLTTGITALKNMTEFVDSNKNRQILMLDGTTLKESVYSGGTYGAVATIASANDKRSVGSTISAFNPNKEGGIIRSGAGIAAASERPIWYGYIPARDRFNAAVTVPAGKYLTDQRYHHATASVNIDPFFITSDYGAHVSELAGGEVATDQRLVFIVSALVDGFQNSFPNLLFGADTSLFVATGSGIEVTLVSPADNNAHPRVTDYDIFIGISTDNKNIDLQKGNYIAYFLERISLNDDGPVITTQTGTVAATSPMISITGEDTWKTFNGVGLFAKIGSNYYRITSDTNSGTTAQFDVTPTPSGGDIGSGKTIEFLSRWDLMGGSFYKYKTFYDNYYKKLGAEMFDFLELPSGDLGIADFRYKWSAVAGKRLFAVGFPDDKAMFGFYSKARELDVLPAQNVLDLRDHPTGIVDVGDQRIIVFYKHSADSFTVFGNGNSRRIDNILEVGCTNFDSIIKAKERLIAFMSYNGPWLINDNQSQFIGEALREWWEDKLSQADLESCVGMYNHKKEWIIFDFPNYTDSVFTNGIMFVFDIRAMRANKFSPWWLLQSNKKFIAQTLNDDQELLAADATSIVNFNSGTINENLNMQVLIGLFVNAEFARKLNIKKLGIEFVDNTIGFNNLTINVYVDSDVGTATPTFTLSQGPTESRESFVQRIATKFDLELVSQNSNTDFTLKTIKLIYKNLQGVPVET